MRSRRLCCSAVLIVIALALFAACRRTEVSGGLAKLHRCQVPGVKEELLCGTFRVFENRKTRTGRTIDLNIVVLPAFDQQTKAEPIFHLDGGPGVAATGAATFYATDGRMYRQRHDVVLVDQRGTGQSNRLSIPQENTPQAALREMYPVD